MFWRSDWKPQATAFAVIGKTGLKDHDQKTQMRYVAFAPTELSRRTKFINAIIPIKPGNGALPVIERLVATNMIGLSIAQNGTVTELWLNLLADGSVRHRNANLVYNGWETDAYLTALTWPAGANRNDPAASRVFVVDGSYLRREGKVVLDSLSKVYLCATRLRATLDVQLQGQPVTNAWLRSAQKPTVVSLNGQRVETAYDENARNLRLSLRVK